MKEIITLEKFVITGGRPLQGEVDISGAKNAAVGILPATILAAGVCVVENLPNISDVSVSLNILSALGAQVRMLSRNTYEIDTTHLVATNVPDDLSRQMRASYYFLGALLSRFGRAQVAMPGGCNLGPRPIDQHLKAFSALGAQDSVDYGMITVRAKEKLRGARIFFDKVSVGATMNAMLSAVMAEGQTILENCAKEPHVVDLANFLNMCGADVRGAGTDVIKVRGVSRMHGCTYSIIPDQIEAGTYMVAAAATGGDVLIRNVTPKHLEPITAKLRRCGAEVEEFDDAVRVTRTGDILPTKINTMPHPGFPTDMQPQMGVLLSVAKGTSTITEGIWDNRFRYVDELRKMGQPLPLCGRAAQDGGQHPGGRPGGRHRRGGAADARPAAGQRPAGRRGYGDCGPDGRRHQRDRGDRPHRARLREHCGKTQRPGGRHPQGGAGPGGAGTGFVKNTLCRGSRAECARLLWCVMREAGRAS